MGTHLEEVGTLLAVTCRTELAVAQDQMDMFAAHQRSGLSTKERSVAVQDLSISSSREAR